MIDETEARQIVLALGTAMLNDDKPSRELVYADLDTDELKRVLRWAMRQLLSQFAFLCALQGDDPLEAWSKMALGFNLHALDEDE